MPPIPPEPWELDYPFRDDLDAARAAVGRGAPAVERAQIAAAYQLERRARAAMAGRSGAITTIDGRRALRDTAASAYAIEAIWQAGRRTPEVQRWVDRAVGCLRQCFEHDVAVWEPDGGRAVTHAFRPLLAYASDPRRTPVALVWEEPAPTPPPRRPPALDVPGLAAAFALVCGLAAAGWWLASSRPAPTAASTPCATQLSDIRADLQRDDRAGLADDAAARAEALARLDAGDVAGAQAVLDASPAVGVHLPAVELFLYRQQCAAGR